MDVTEVLQMLKFGHLVFKFVIYIDVFIPFHTTCFMELLEICEYIVLLDVVILSSKEDCKKVYVVHAMGETVEENSFLKYFPKFVQHSNSK